MPNVKVRPPCGVEGCSKPHQANGMCAKHRSRFERHGDANYGEPEYRYHHSYTKGASGECWPWSKGFGRGGYGKFKADGRTFVASRYGWELLNGPIPEGMLVCHTCDNPPCQNPEHWFLGTARDNAEDMIRKGRQRWDQPKSVENGQFISRLTAR